MLFLDDWRSDQYRWSNQGVHLLPKKNPTVRKSYFQIDTPEGPTDKFIKHAYQLVNATGFSKDVVWIHYLGDDSYAIDFPHGNSSGEAQGPHSRTIWLILIIDHMAGIIMRIKFDKIAYKNYILNI